MYLTGFADEAASSLEGQIRATAELGWKDIESRNIDGVNIHDLPLQAFERACARLEEAGVRVNCFGSTIANWGKKITDPFEITLEEVRRAVPRMQRLGSRLIRIMSYAVLKDARGKTLAEQMEEERFRRLREICRIFRDAGLTPVHENCMNYGGLGWTYTLKMLENVPDLRLVFDTGNPILNDDHTRPEPRPRQSSWDFYSHVKEHVEYVHIKDAVHHPESGESTYTFPGEGAGEVRRIVADLLKSGYDGGFSMEPHMAVVFHDASVQSNEGERYRNYLEYSRRFMELLKGLGCPPERWRS